MHLDPLENSPSDGKDFVDEHRLEVGQVPPPTEKTFKEYFPPDQSFLLRSNKRVSGLFYYRAGRDKQVPTAVFRALADSRATLKRLVEKIERVAVAGEKIIVRTSVFGYDSKKLQALKTLGYKIGASLPGTVSLSGKRYDYHILYKDLPGRYGFTVARSYAKPGLYQKTGFEECGKVPGWLQEGYIDEIFMTLKLD